MIAQVVKGKISSRDMDLPNDSGSSSILSKESALSAKNFEFFYSFRFETICKNPDFDTYCNASSLNVCNLEI